MLHEVYIFSYIINLAYILYVTKQHFTAKDGNTLPLLMLYYITSCYWFISLYFLFYYTVNEFIYTLSILLTLLSLFVLYKAKKSSNSVNLSLAFTENTSKRIVTKGIYSWIRHPFYTGYLLTYFGACIATQQYVILFLFAILCTIYYYLTLQEETVLSSYVEYKYDEYKRKTSRFIPFI